MNVADITAVFIVIVCVLLALSGFLKWILRIGFGLLLGTSLIVALSLLTENQQFNRMSGGLFEGGTIVPTVKACVVKDPDHLP